MTRLSSKLREYERICDETYQVVGVLAAEANRFMDDEVTRVLDNLSLHEIVHEDILPFPSKKAMPSDKEIKEVKETLEMIKPSCPVEYYEKLKTFLDYF